MKAPLPADETERLKALCDYGVLDTLPEPEFDDIVELAAQICGTPISMISLVDDQRQWFKAKRGLEVSETSRDVAFCAHTILLEDVLVIEDARLDHRFSKNPLVQQTDGIRFYAGAPLMTPEGYKLGALCVADRKPGKLTAEQRRALKLLSKHVMNQLHIRRRAQEAISTNASLEIAARISLGIWRLNLLNPKLTWSPKVYEIHEAPRDYEPNVETAIEFYAPEYQAAISKAVEACSSVGTPFDMELQIITVKGRRVWVRAIGEAVRNQDGDIIELQGVFQDIEERKRAEEDVREKAALLDKAQDAIVVRDLQHKIIYWNKSAERVYGWTAQDIFGKSTRDLIYVDKELFDQSMQALLLNGECSGEYKHVNKEGAILTVESRWTLVRDEKGKPKSVLGINTDVTERKKLEYQFLRAQRMESLGTLAGGIAHDLNNLLSPIVMGVELLKMYQPEKQAQQIIENISASANRGRDLVKQVLSFARGVEGARVSVQLKHVVRELEGIIHSTFPKNIHVDIDLEENLGLVLGDPTQLEQVLLNLCVNARDAMPEGGKLSIVGRNVYLDEHYATVNRGIVSGNYVCLEVADTGAGMSSEVLNRIFEPFFSTKEVGKGTGLGLSTVQGIIRSHGGVINGYSEVGKGSSFKTYLPLQEDAEVGTKRLENERLTRGNGELILLVDDEISILNITKQTLEAFGYRVVTAEDGAHAVGIYATQRHDIEVVLTDMMMPVMDGPTLIAALRRIDPEVKIIAASGLNANGNVAKAAHAGVTHFLPKPYSADAMLSILHLVIWGNDLAT